MEALLRAGADPNAKVPFGEGASFTAVFTAASIADPAILRLLLQYGGDPNAAFEGTPNTALMRAFELGHQEENWENYYTLLNAGADINRVLANRTIAEFAASLDYFDKMAELLERGYNVRLLILGLHVTAADPAIMGARQQHWRGVVRSMLQERGIQFPVTAEQVHAARDAGEF
jgi:hypothetical protein